MAITIGDLLSYVDSMKRRAGSTLAQLASDPGEGFSQMGASLRESMPERITRPGLSAQEQFRQVANPDAVLGSSVANVASGFAPMLGGVMTYHGTPHNVSAWDLGKVGTGQRAQSYGHGMYFAENPATARSYQRELSGSSDLSSYLWGGKKFQARESPEAHALSLTYWESKSTAKRIAQQGLDDLKTGQPYAVERGQEYWQRMLDQANAIKSKKDIKTEQGYLYKQDLPDEMLPKMLQWDKPLSEQPEAVQKLFSGVERLHDHHVRKKVTTGEALGELSGTLGGREQAAEFLRQRGIPGLSYLDAGSRGAGKGTMNHVIWDQELLNRMTPRAVE